MKVWKFITGNIYIKNLLLAIGISVLLVFLVLWWLNFYTQHGIAVEVPDVKGISVEEAASALDKRSLRYEVVDSVYTKGTKPGSVVETFPVPDTKVKENRIVYLTINALSSQTFIIPEVRDLSQRQATAMLTAIGFNNISVEHVPGSYRDLVVGIKCRGKEVLAGERLPAQSNIVLEISYESNAVLVPDSVTNDETPESKDDSWF